MHQRSGDYVHPLNPGLLTGVDASQLHSWWLVMRSQARPLFTNAGNFGFMLGLPPRALSHRASFDTSTHNCGCRITVHLDSGSTPQRGADSLGNEKPANEESIPARSISSLATTPQRTPAEEITDASFESDPIWKVNQHRINTHLYSHDSSNR